MTNTNDNQWTCKAFASTFQKECRSAFEDDKVFAKFRQLPFITGVVETRPNDWTDLFLKAVEASGVIDMEQALKAAMINDSFGGAVTAPWRGTKIAGTTASYLLQLSIIKTMFGSVHEFDIVEIGGGYGGQASVVVNLDHPKGYTVCDLPDVLKLIKKYTDLTCPNANIKLTDCPVVDPHDLLISCCALSELNDLGMSLYGETIKNAARGILTWSITAESATWAKNMDTAIDKIKSVSGRNDISLATSSPKFCKTFAWWAPNTILWGH